MLQVMKANGGGLLRTVLVAAVIPTAAGAAGAAGAAHAQDPGLLPPVPSESQENRLLRRWVGAKVNGLPLWLDFFGDSMLVISDNVNQFAVSYALTPTAAAALAKDRRFARNILNTPIAAVRRTPP